jgi:hypothetical protein
MKHLRPARLGVLAMPVARRRIVLMLALAVVLAAGVVFGGLVVLANRAMSWRDGKTVVDPSVFAAAAENLAPGRRDVIFVIHRQREAVTREELLPLRLVGFIEAELPELTGEHDALLTELGLPLVCAGRILWHQRRGFDLIASGSRGEARVQIGSVALIVPTWISFPRFAANVAMLTPITFAGIVLVVFAAGRARRAWRRRAGRCAACGYDARGLSKCPECGSAAGVR